MFKKATIAVCLAAFSIGAAAAADLPPYNKAPPKRATLDSPWSGIYVGLNLALAKTKGEFAFVNIPGTGNIYPTGVMPGVVVGAGTWLGAAWVGVEADANYDFIKTNNPCIVVLNCHIKTSIFLTQRAMLGMPLPAITGALPAGGLTPPSQWPIPLNVPANVAAANVMPYLTAGIAERRISACVDAAFASQGCGKEWLVGPTGGAGLRIPISANFSLDLSYLYARYNKNFVPASTAVIFPGSFTAKSENIASAKFIGHF